MLSKLERWQINQTNQLKEIFIMPGANVDEDRKIFVWFGYLSYSKRLGCRRKLIDYTGETKLAILTKSQNVFNTCKFW